MLKFHRFPSREASEAYLWWEQKLNEGDVFFVATSTYYQLPLSGSGLCSYLPLRHSGWMTFSFSFHDVNDESSFSHLSFFSLQQSKRGRKTGHWTLATIPLSNHNIFFSFFPSFDVWKILLMVSLCYSFFLDIIDDSTPSAQSTSNNHVFIISPIYQKKNFFVRLFSKVSHIKNTSDWKNERQKRFFAQETIVGKRGGNSFNLFDASATQGDENWERSDAIFYRKRYGCSCRRIWGEIVCNFSLEIFLSSRTKTTTRINRSEKFAGENFCGKSH